MVATLQLPPLTKQAMAQLATRARHLGVLPEDYAKTLVEDGLALQRQAERASFEQIMRPVRKAAGTVDEAEIVKLVGQARADHRRRLRRGKKR